MKVVDVEVDTFVLTARTPAHLLADVLGQLDVLGVGSKSGFIDVVPIIFSMPAALKAQIAHERARQAALDAASAARVQKQEAEAAAAAAAAAATSADDGKAPTTTAATATATSAAVLPECEFESLASKFHAPRVKPLRNMKLLWESHAPQAMNLLFNSGRLNLDTPLAAPASASKGKHDSEAPDEAVRQHGTILKKKHESTVTSEPTAAATGSHSAPTVGTSKVRKVTVDDGKRTGETTSLSVTSAMSTKKRSKVNTLKASTPLMLGKESVALVFGKDSPVKPQPPAQVPEDAVSLQQPEGDHTVALRPRRASLWSAGGALRFDPNHDDDEGDDVDSDEASSSATGREPEPLAAALTAAAAATAATDVGEAATAPGSSQHSEESPVVLPPAARALPPPRPTTPVPLDGSTSLFGGNGVTFTASTRIGDESSGAADGEGQASGGGVKKSQGLNQSLWGDGPLLFASAGKGKGEATVKKKEEDVAESESEDATSGSGRGDAAPAADHVSLVPVPVVRVSDDSVDSLEAPPPQQPKKSLRKSLWEEKQMVFGARDEAPVVTAVVEEGDHESPLGTLNSSHDEDAPGSPVSGRHNSVVSDSDHDTPVGHNRSRSFPNVVAQRLVGDKRGAKKRGSRILRRARDAKRDKPVFKLKPKRSTLDIDDMAQALGPGASPDPDKRRGSIDSDMVRAVGVFDVVRAQRVVLTDAMGRERAFLGLDEDNAAVFRMEAGREGDGALEMRVAASGSDVSMRFTGLDEEEMVIVCTNRDDGSGIALVGPDTMSFCEFGVEDNNVPQVTMGIHEGPTYVNLRGGHPEGFDAHLNPKDAGLLLQGDASFAGIMASDTQGRTRATLAWHDPIVSSASSASATEASMAMLHLSSATSSAAASCMPDASIMVLDGADPRLFLARSPGDDDDGADASNGASGRGASDASSDSVEGHGAASPDAACDRRYHVIPPARENEAALMYNVESRGGWIAGVNEHGKQLSLFNVQDGPAKLFLRHGFTGAAY